MGLSSFYGKMHDVDVGAQVFRFFRQHGYSPYAAAGIVGNAQQESSLNPNAAGGGLIQGQGGRTSSGSLQQQLHGILGELQGPERGTSQALRGSSSAAQAALIFSKRFERPGIPNNPARERYAQQALKRYGGNAVGSEVAGAGGTGGLNTTTTTTGSSPQQQEALESVLAKVKSLTRPQPQSLAAGASAPLTGAVASPTLPAGYQPNIPLAAKPEADQGKQLQSLLAGLLAGGASETTTTKTATPGEPGAAGEPGGSGAVQPGPGSYGALAGKGLTFAGPDQGVDFTGGGAVRAPSDIQITRVAKNTGWSGEGNILVGKILSGPAKGRYQYIAEDFAPAGHLKPGSVVRAGELLGRATGSGKAPGIEVGFAQDAHGTAFGTTHDGKAGGPSPTHGIEFERYLASLLKRR